MAKNRHVIPNGLLDAGAPWAMPFTCNAIKDAIEDAY